MAKRLTNNTEEKTLATAQPIDAEWRAIESVVIGGDLAPLTPEQRVRYMQRVCTSLGLNWETSPFIYVKPADKMILYATKDCAAQLRRRDGISIEVTGRSFMPEQGIYCVEVKATNAQGRSETAIGVVGITGMKHETLAGQMMRAETKAKRRVTLSLCGLGLDGEDDVQAFSPIGNGTAKGDRTTDSLMAGNAAEDGARQVGPRPSAIQALLVSDDSAASTADPTRHQRTGTPSAAPATKAEPAGYVDAKALASAPFHARVLQKLADNIAREAAPADNPSEPFILRTNSPEIVLEKFSENLTREAAAADRSDTGAPPPPKTRIVEKAMDILSPLGFEVVAETASPAALEDEIEVFADELVDLNEALGEKKTSVKAIRSWLAKTHPNDLAAQAAEIKRRVEDKRAKVASLSATA